jgi:peroxiredoxin
MHPNHPQRARHLFIRLPLGGLRLACAATLLTFAAPAALAQSSDGADNQPPPPAAGPLAPNAPAAPSAAPAAPAAPAAVPPPPGHDLSAREALIGAASTMRRARAVAFDFSFRTEGDPLLAGLSPVIEKASVVLVRAPGGGNWQVRLHGEGQVTRDRPAEPFDVAWLADRTEWLDHAERTIRERPAGVRASGAAGERVRFADPLRPKFLLDPDPFAPALNAQRLTSEAPQTIGGVECDVVLVEFGGATTKERFFIARSDRFLRRHERLFEGAVQSVTAYGVSNLRINEGVDDTDVLIERPADYALDRQAPAQPATPTPQPLNPNAGVPGAGSIAAGLGPPAPSFTLKTPKGEAVTLDTLRGGVAVIDFFGTWSVPARRWHPQLRDALASHPEVKAYAAAVRERSPENPANYLAEEKLPFTLLLNADDTARTFGVRTYPATLVLGPEGEQVALVQSLSLSEHAAAVKAAIARALGGPAPAGNPAAAAPAPSTKGVVAAPAPSRAAQPVPSRARKEQREEEDAKSKGDAPPKR